MEPTQLFSKLKSSLLASTYGSRIRTSLILLSLPHLNLRCGYAWIRICLLILQVLWKIVAIDDETIVININVLHRFYIQNGVITLLVTSMWLSAIILKLAEIVLKLQLIIKFNLISRSLTVS